MVVGGIIELFKQKGAWLGFVYIFAWIGVTVTCILIIWLIVEFFSSDTWEMFKGMGYSVKNKVCPMIKWDEKNEH